MAIRYRQRTLDPFPLMLDAVAMALYCVCSTISSNEAVVSCINFLGDANTTGAITAQIAGAFYGMESIQEEWKQDLEQWGKGGFTT